MMASLVMAGGKDATADDEAGMSPEGKVFIKGLIDQTVTIIAAGGVPKDIDAFNLMFNQTAEYVSKAQDYMLDANGNKEKAAPLKATLAELNGKEKKSKEEKDSVQALNSQLLKLATESESLNAEKKEDVARALGYMSQAVLNYTLMAVGGKDVVASLKAQGPAAIGKVKEISGVISALPDNLKATKQLTGTTIATMKIHSLTIPSPEKATEGITKG